MKDEITVADDLLFDAIDKLKRLDEADVADDRERTRRELAIYHGYFDTLSKVVQNPHADGKNETARAFVGRHIHPGYTLMPGAITAYTNNAAIIPTKERIDFFSAFDELMLVIYARWNDCANAALNVRACFDDVSDKIATLDNVRAMTKEAAAQFAADMDGLHQRLRQRLIELSGVLTDTPANRESKLLAAIQDVAKQEAEHHKENMDAHSATHARLPKKPRADKGGKHTMRKNRTAASVDGVKHTAEWLAGVLNRSKFQPEKGAGWLGACTKGKIEKWDKWCADHPGERNKWGYRTELRTDSGRYNELMEFIAKWAGYWNDYKIQFKRWRTGNPKLPRSAFRFKPLRRSDTDPARIGRTDEGDLVIEPRPDPRRS